MKSLPEIIKIIASDTSPPLWNITEWFVFNTLGTDEIFIRGLAFTYFLLSVLFTYKIGVLLWNKKTAFLAGVLTFLNPFFFTYAFEGRMYSILALGTTASMYYFLKIIRANKANNKDQLGYILATLWAMYSHHFAIFAVFLQGVWFIYEYLFGKRKAATRMVKGFIGVGIGYLPWLIPLYNQTKMVGGGFWLGTPTVKDLIKMIVEYLALGIKHNLDKLALLFVLLTLIFKNWKQNTKTTIFLLTWFLGPILLTWVVSQTFQSIFFNRYLLYAIPAAMLILASERKKLSLAFIITTITVFCIIDLHYFTHPTKRPFKQLANYVHQTKQENDYIINWNAGSHHLWESK
jgi:mannosyltransferase